ncbi:MAG TPA: hypothetical protein VFO11_06925 [Candidatus Polarisedimenticolaceae bacterium]|nr:hypothetical protein [Candidatus Polarisedimenticolaceae bacterium]
MTQSSRFDAARAVMAFLLAIGLPALAQAATSRTPAPAKAEASRTARQQAATTRISPVLEFLAKSVGDEQEAMASPHVPPGRPADRPPSSPPGQDDPPNPPGKPGDRPNQ